MVALGREHEIEVCLFAGPRANWDMGVQAAAAAGRVMAGRLRGGDQLRHGIDDVPHGSALGVRGVSSATSVTSPCWPRSAGLGTCRATPCSRC